MEIRARVQNSVGEHPAPLATNGNSQSIAIPPKASGVGSGANGGQLLFLALATRDCNDIDRDAAKRGLPVERVEVGVEGQCEAEIQNTLRVATRDPGPNRGGCCPAIDAPIGVTRRREA